MEALRIRTSGIFRHLQRGYDGGYSVVSLQGSSRSGKTYNTVIWLVVYCLLNAGSRVSIVRATLPAIKGSVFQDFKDVLLRMELWDDRALNKSEFTYKFSNGSWVEFFSTDSEQKLRGRKRDVLYVNEANELRFIEWQQLQMRTSRFSIVDYNPSFSDDHWICELNKEEKTYHFVSTYRDNPFLEQKIIDEIESLRWKNESLWRIYGLGLQARVEGLIFTNVSECESIPSYIDRRWVGVDFGYANDPTAIVEVAIEGNDVYIREIAYNTQMLTNDIIQVLKNEPCSGKKVISESADPRLVEEIYRARINIHPVTKYKGSIEAGITKMLEYNFHITKDSTNAWKEFKNYTYQQDKEGKWLNQPIDAYNHCFTAETSVLTLYGEKPIINIKVGDIVATSQGFKSVTKIYQNGRKKIRKVRLNFSTFVVELNATSNHLIKTTNGWKRLEQLTAGETLYVSWNLMGNVTRGRQSVAIIEKLGAIATRCLEMFMSMYMGSKNKERCILQKTEIMLMCVWKTLLKPLCRNYVALKGESMQSVPSLNTSTVNDTTCIMESGIIAKERSVCTLRSGSSIMGKFQRVVKYIIKILTALIMILRTWNVCLLQNIKKSTKSEAESLGNQKSKYNILQIFVRKPRNGTEAMRGANGIGNTLLKLQNRLSRHYTNAVVVARSIIQRVFCQSFVVTNVRQKQGAQRKKTMKNVFVQDVAKSLRQTDMLKQNFAHAVVLESIDVIKESEAEVFDIEVAEAHEFFANGVLVHNCIDAIRYVFMEQVMGGEKRKVDVNRIRTLINR